MRNPSDSKIGYGHPPEKTRWKKGQCGNPNRMRKCTPPQIVQLIDDFFSAQIDIVENGIPRRVSNFEAILLQLLTKAATSNSRAMNVLLDYKKFAASRGTMGGLEVERIIIRKKGSTQT